VTTAERPRAQSAPRQWVPGSKCVAAFVRTEDGRRIDPLALDTAAITPSSVTDQLTQPGSARERSPYKPLGTACAGTHAARLAGSTLEHR
jgi:hypothetical protein